MATTKVDVVSPTGVVWRGEPEMVVAKTSTGEIAWLANHTAFLGALQTCVLRLVPAQGTEIRVALDGGFVEVRDNQVNVLADRAVLAGDVDVAASRAALRTAEDRLRADETDQAAEANRTWAAVLLEAAGEAPVSAGG